MQVRRYTLYANGHCDKMKLTGDGKDGKVYLNNKICSSASWFFTGSNEEYLSITYSHNPDKAGHLHEFKLIDAESGLYHLITKNGIIRHPHRLLLIRNRTIVARIL